MCLKELIQIEKATIMTTYDSVRGPYILAKRQKWQIDTVDRLFPCQLYRVTLFLTPMANNDTAL